MDIFFKIKKNIFRNKYDSTKYIVVVHQCDEQLIICQTINIYLFYQAVVAIKINIFFFFFCSFVSSCHILEKEIFIENMYLVLYC